MQWQFIRSIKGAKNFSEVHKTILEAKKCNEFHNAVLHEAIKKLTTRDCQNVKLGYELARQIPVESFEYLDAYTLNSILICASQNGDYSLAHKSFCSLNHLNSYSFYYYIASFKDVRSKSLPPEVSYELESLWKKVEHFGLDNNFKLLTQLYSALSFSREKQRSLVLQIISKPAHDSFDCGLIGTFLKHCSETDDIDLANRVWAWGGPIRETGKGTLKFFLISFQYHRMKPLKMDELNNLWSQVISNCLDGKVELVANMCSSLSFDRLEQRNFILHVLSKKPNDSFNCGLLGGFLKHCSATNDRGLANEIWNWSSSIRDRECGTFAFFYLKFQYCRLHEPNIDELKNLWRQVKGKNLDGKVELVNCMTSALSFNRMEQRDFILNIISKKPDCSFDCGLLGGFLRCCSETGDMELAKNVWDWGRSILEHERGTFQYFLATLNYYCMNPPRLDELNDLWRQVISKRLDGRAELVTSMCSALSFDSVAQSNFIKSVISKEPSRLFDCGLMGFFIKQCTEFNDEKLVKDVWHWGRPIIGKDTETFDSFLVTFQYYKVEPPPIDELKAFWNRVISKRLDRRAELVTSMCDSLSNYISEQRNFILSILSEKPQQSFDSGVLGAFLKHCSDQHNLELAQNVWTWGLQIRIKDKGTLELCKVTIQYLTICAGFGDSNQLEKVWEEAKRFDVDRYVEVKGAFITSLASIGAADRILTLFHEIHSDSVSEHILVSTLNSLSHAGRDLEALDLLRRFQIENPIIVSTISYASVIDAFSRNGNFAAAFSLIEEGKHHGIHPNVITWMSILSPCRYHKNLPVALRAFEELKKVKHEPQDLTAAYVLLADVYKSCGDEVTAGELHKERIGKGLFKVRGGVQLALSENEVLTFHVGEVPCQLTSEEAKSVHRLLDSWRAILENKGLSSESVNCRHSEMLALAYAIGCRKMRTVFLRKNLRVCLDCHAATLAISRMYNVDILLQDQSRLHIIRNGACSCGCKY